MQDNFENYGHLSWIVVSFWFPPIVSSFFFVLIVLSFVPRKIMKHSRFERSPRTDIAQWKLERYR